MEWCSNNNTRVSLVNLKTDTGLPLAPSNGNGSRPRSDAGGCNGFQPLHLNSNDHGLVPAVMQGTSDLATTSRQDSSALYDRPVDRARHNSRRDCRACSSFHDHGPRGHRGCRAGFVRVTGDGPITPTGPTGHRDAGFAGSSNAGSVDHSRSRFGRNCLCVGE